MSTNYLLAATAVFYALSGLLLLFVPDVFLVAIGATLSVAGSWAAQSLGAALLGFAWLNWMQRHLKTEGIYGRSVLLPNLVFVSVSFWSALAAWRRAPSPQLLLCGVLLGALSVAFGARLFARGTPS